MKKLTILLGLILNIGLMNNSFAQKDRTLSNGFSFNLVTGFPSAMYATDGTIEITDENKFRTLWGFKLGNRWYFEPTEKMGFALMVNWVDITMTGNLSSNSGVETSRSAAEMSLFEFGPLGTYVIGNGMAIDAYYNFRPNNFSAGYIISESGVDDKKFNYSGIGVSSAIGLAFRIKIFNAGFEYNFGAIKSSGTYTYSETKKTLKDAELKTNSLRFMVGIKF